MMNRKSQDYLMVILGALFCIILYFNSLGNSFVFDDLHTISDNLYIKDFSYSHLFFRGYYTSVPIPPGMFRPLLLLTFAFNYFFGGLNPWGYHIINILIHFLNAILLYCILRKLKKDIFFVPSLILTLLFISHPINTQAVSYITCRSDLLLSFFVMSSFLFYINRRFFLTLLLYSLGLLTKETSLALPLLIFVYDFIFRPITKAHPYSKRNTFIFYIFLMGVTITYWVYRGIIFDLQPRDIVLSLIPMSSPLRSLWSNILIQSVVSLFYLRLFVWPSPLSIHYNFPEIDSLFNPIAFFSVLGIISMIVSAYFLRRRYPLISLGIFWYLIFLLPKFYAFLNIVAALHHSYLPSIGLYIILAVLVQRLYPRFRKLFIYASVGIISIFSVLVWFRNYEWRDAFSVWKSAIRVDPSSALAQHNLGAEYLDKGMYPQAEEHIRKALSLSNAIDIQVNGRMALAKIIWESQKNFSEAETILKEIKKIAPLNYRIYHFLGRLYLVTGRQDEAEETLKKALSLYPQSAYIQQELGSLYLQQNRLKEARDYFQLAIKSDPDSYLAYFGLGQVLEEESEEEGAIEVYKKAIKINPALTWAHYSLGTLYAQRQDRRSLRHLKEAVRLNPNFAEAHNNLAVLYASFDPPQLELARQHVQKALDLGYKVDEQFLKMIDLPVNP